MLPATFLFVFAAKQTLVLHFRLNLSLKSLNKSSKVLFETVKLLNVSNSATSIIFSIKVLFSPMMGVALLFLIKLNKIAVQSVYRTLCC